VTSTRPLGIALLVPVLAAVAFSYTRFALETFDVPSDEDYVAARRVLDDEGFDRERDAVVILPPWSLRPLQAFGDLDPICGDDIAHRPLHRWARLWAVVEPDADKELDPLIERRGQPAWVKRTGRVVVERFDLPEPSVVYDLRAHLDDAVVRVVDVDGGGEETPCTARVKGGVSCGKASWQRVTRQWLLVSENGDDVVWSHPPPHGQRLEISWKDVPIGSGVVVQAGFTREGADAAKAAVRLKVLVDGELAGTVVRKPQELGGTFSFYADVVDTKAFAGRTATLTFAVDADDNASAHFAWDATVVR
jgi:hypothetical protein